MTLYVACDQGQYAVNDRVHSIYGLNLDQFLQLVEDYNSGYFNAGELFAAARERRSGTIQ